MATDEKGSGFVGHLTPSQEVKLQQLWMIILKGSNTQESSIAPPAIVTDSQDLAQHQDRRNSLSRIKSNPSGETRILSSSTNCSHLTEAFQMMDISASDMKSTEEVLLGMGPGQLRMGFLSAIQNENPDTFLLRFLRARKWDVIKAFTMMASAIQWRMKEMNVDQLMAEGELQALKVSQGTSNTSDKKTGHDFLAQIRMGKSFVHGFDTTGRPICVVRVRLHRPGEQSEETLERRNGGTCYTQLLRITLARSFAHVLRETEPVTHLRDLQTVVFDMTGFSLSNMTEEWLQEYSPVKFIIKCFEANYPECLGVLLIHNAPWVFSGIWRLIKGWLDPVIASKIYFTNNAADLQKFISRERIVQELGGDDDWAYKYVEPSLDENDIMKDTASRDVLLTERQRLADDLLLATSAWIAATTARDDAEIATCMDRRAANIKWLHSNYWQLDPYLRARTVLDRTGAFKDHRCDSSEESLAKIREA